MTARIDEPGQAETGDAWSCPARDGTLASKVRLVLLVPVAGNAVRGAVKVHPRDVMHLDGCWIDAQRRFTKVRIRVMHLGLQLGRKTRPFAVIARGRESAGRRRYLLRHAVVDFRPFVGVGAAMRAQFVSVRPAPP